MLISSLGVEWGALCWMVFTSRLQGMLPLWVQAWQFSTLQLKYQSKNKSLPQPLWGNSFGWSHGQMQTSPAHVDDQTMKLQGLCVAPKLACEAMTATRCMAWRQAFQTRLGSNGISSLRADARWNDAQISEYRRWTRLEDDRRILHYLHSSLQGCRVWKG